MANKVLKQNGIVLNIIIGMGILLLFLFVINPPARSATGINLGFLVIAYLVYQASEYQDDLFGITSKNAILSIAFGVLFTGIFIFVTFAVPGMSIGYPSLPASISDSLKFFLVVFVAPIVETIFFQGAVYAYVSNFDTTPNKRKKWRAVVIQAIVFAIFHLGAYVAGFYMYPGFTAGMQAITANISSFIVAFIFALLAGWFVTTDGIKNLIFVMIFHLGLNLYAYSLSVAVFLSTIPLFSVSPLSALAILPTIPLCLFVLFKSYQNFIGRTYK